MKTLFVCGFCLLCFVATGSPRKVAYAQSVSTSAASILETKSVARAHRKAAEEKVEARVARKLNGAHRREVYLCYLQANESAEYEIKQKQEDESRYALGEINAEHWRNDFYLRPLAHKWGLTLEELEAIRREGDRKQWPRSQYPPARCGMPEFAFFYCLLCLFLGFVANLLGRNGLRTFLLCYFFTPLIGPILVVIWEVLEHRGIV